MRYLACLWLVVASLSLHVSADEMCRLKPHCFTTFSAEESVTDWAREYKIGLGFAKRLEYPNAIVSFKRALILSPENSLRTSEIEYAIVLSYYFDRNYHEVIKFFETHSLLYVDPSFKAYHDLMIVLYHCYEITKQSAKADLIMKRLEAVSALEASQMKLTGAIIRRDLKAAQEAAEKTSHKELVTNLTEVFLKKKKSLSLAKWMNVFIPGLGYLYLGQKKAALTSFLINVLLIAGAAQLFIHHYYALGCLTALLEIGWYAGGVFGAQHSAYLYNETLFTNYAEKIFYHESLSPENKLYYEF